MKKRTETCLCILFAKNQPSSNGYRFFGQCDVAWSELKVNVESLLKSKNVPDPSFARIGLFNELGQPPEQLQSINDFFHRITNGRTHMILLVEVLTSRKQDYELFSF